MALSLTNSLNSVISNVKKLKKIPSFCIYSITPKGNGISAVDVNLHNLHLAYSPANSRDIYVTLDPSETDLTGDLNDAWLKHVAARNAKNKEEIRMEGNSSESSQIYVFQHGAHVTGLNFTPDGNFLLSSGTDTTVKAWSASSFQLVETYYGTSGVFSDIHVNSIGTHFATSSTCKDLHQNAFMHEISLYSLENKFPISTFTGHSDNIECVRFHPNGLYIATASADKTIKLWCTRTSKLVRNFQLTDWVERNPKKLVFSPDGKFLTSSNHESVKVLDLASGKIIKCLKIPNSMPYILNLCYNDSGNLLATGGSNKRLHLWDMKMDSSNSSDIKPETEFLKCENLQKTIHCLKYNASNFFTCVTS